MTHHHAPRSDQLQGMLRGHRRLPTHTGRSNAMHNGQTVTDLMTRVKDGGQQAWDALVERYAPLVWSICRRYRLGRADAERRRPDRVAAPGRPAGPAPRTGRAPRLAGHHHPARMPAGTGHRAQDKHARAAAGRRGHPRRAGRGGRAGAARSRTPRRAARSLHRPAAALPAAAGPAYPGPARPLRRDQRPAGHRGRQHRADPQPLPGQAAPPPGHHRPDQRRNRPRGHLVGLGQIGVTLAIFGD
jgi:hypothetical protein